ncbi:MAG: hypothetical protein ACYC6L_03940 [Anaerolineae bacterium]
MSNYKGMRVGAASADITPAPGIQLGGDIGRYRPTEEVRMPLKARALVVEQDGRRAVVLACDVIAINDDITVMLQNEIGALAGCPPGAVLLHAVQSHSSPAVGDHWVSGPSPYVTDDLWYVRGGDARYNETFHGGVLAAVRQAAANLRPASLQLGRVTDGRVAFNRRFIMRDGTVKTHPPTCSPDILQVEGPTDPEVGLALFADASGAPLAAILHHTCHPVHGYPMRWVHPDWPGAWAEAMAEELGIPGAVLTLNGFCGNIHHNHHLSLTHVDTIEANVACLRESARRARTLLKPSASQALAWRSTTLEIPWRRLTKAKIAAAKALLKAQPQPVFTDTARTAVNWDWCYAVANLDLARRQAESPSYPYVITALRIGDLALVGWPGEPFVQPQLALKAQSPSPYLFGAHMTGGCAGYQPDAAAIRRGGYETWVANTSCLAADTGDRALAATLGLLGEMWG